MTTANADGANDTFLFRANVVDDATGAPIPKFHVLAGVSPFGNQGWQWQPHTIHVFKDGKLQWPPPGSRGYNEQVLRVEAEGYIPYQSPIVTQTDSGEPTTLEIRLARDAGIAGRVIDPSGQPAKDAVIAVGMMARTISLRQGTILHAADKPDATLRDRWQVPRHARSDREGRFTLPAEIAPATLVVAHPLGVAVLDFSDFIVKPEVMLQPWGTIAGRVQWGAVPGANEKVTLIAHGGRPREGWSPFLMVNDIRDTDSDANGRFTFEFVPPGRAQLSFDNHLPYQHIDVAAGTTTHAVLGGRGRPVIGKLTGREEWQDVRVRIAPNAPRPGDMGTEHDPWPAYGQFLASAAGKNYVKSNILVQVDGSFRIDDVPAEHYQLFVSTRSADGKSNNIGYSSFHVDTIPGGETDEPLDLGQVKVRP